MPMFFVKRERGVCRRCGYIGPRELCSCHSSMRRLVGQAIELLDRGEVADARALLRDVEERWIRVMDEANAHYRERMRPA